MNIDTFDLPLAKAAGLPDQSDSIVVSFGAEWHEPLLAKQFSVVIRKRIPRAASFKWLYFHVNSPIGAICARAPIRKIFTATKKQALALASRIHLSSDDIAAYIGLANDIGCYELGPFQFAKKPATTTELAAQLVYHPPQSFFIVSKRAKKIIDQAAGFSKG